MTIIKVLNDPIFTLPKFSDNDTYPVFLENSFNTFLETIDQTNKGTIVEKIKLHKPILEKFCATLVQSLNTYYNGHPARAYSEFEEGMKLIETFLFPKRVLSNSSDTIPLFRARVGSNRQYERKEMFHMPFELRNHVTTQRFSIPGLPCLYLSNSSYVCWEELKRPDIFKLQISRYRLDNKKFKLLDLSMTPYSLLKMLELTTSEEFLKDIKQEQQYAIDGWDFLTLSYLMKWPLIAACSIKVKEQNASFKPEYIFPQFLLQWVTHNKKIDGIKYFSVEAHMTRHTDYSKFINYAIPIKESAESGYCKSITESFSLTEPVSWELMTIAEPEVIKHDKKKQEQYIKTYGVDNILLEVIKGKEILYWHTVFGKIEIELSQMELAKI